VGLTQFIVLAVVQAAAEVLPVGAEAHVLLLSALLEWSGPTPGLRLVLKGGFLLGVMAYFWRDLGEMIVGLARAAKGKRDSGARLALQITAAAIPTLGLGFVFELYVAGAWQTPGVMGWAALGGALLLFLADRMCMTVKRVEHGTVVDAIVVGLGQVVALVPGAGSVAVSMILARLLGYERREAVRLTFLLAIPVASAVVARDAFTLFRVEHGTVALFDILAGVASFLATIIAIAILMTWLRRGTFTPFVMYRFALAATALTLAYGWIS
jgi:undecaprenyl-diphosphatase